MIALQLHLLGDVLLRLARFATRGVTGEHGVEVVDERGNHLFVGRGGGVVEGRLDVAAHLVELFVGQRAHRFGRRRPRFVGAVDAFQLQLFELLVSSFQHGDDRRQPQRGGVGGLFCQIHQQSVHVQALGHQHLRLNAFVGVDQLHEPFGRFAQCLHGRAAVVADGREELRKERVAVVVQLLHLSRQLGVGLGVVQLHFLRNQVVPSLEQLVGEVQFLLVLRCNQVVKLLMQFAMHCAGMRCDTSSHPHVAGSRFF